MTTDRIHFLLNGRDVVVADASPKTTLLTWLRESAALTGTKEGCAEGDCGACTVVVADELDGRLRWRSLNACLQLLPTLHAKALFTVEALRAPDGSLHPAQQALVECHGSQCGFCTPGVTMSLAALLQNCPSPTDRDIRDALSGNLCRCTGYRPIIDAARRMYELDARAWRSPLPVPARYSGGDEEGLLPRLAAIEKEGSLVLTHLDEHFAAPTSLAELDALYAAEPHATLLAGGTDIGIWITKGSRPVHSLIHLGRVPELARITETESMLVIGAAVTLEDAFSALQASYPEATELFRRFGSRPIRNAGTLCGNIANGSPIGDSMPALIALGAQMRLRQAGRTRELALEDLYPTGHNRFLMPGEFVESVIVPKRPGCTAARSSNATMRADGFHFAAWKVSKRYDQDISAVCTGLALTIERGRIRTARLAFGGMASTPRRALRTEAALLGRPLDADSIADAQVALACDFTPISDLRASAGYRMALARNLLMRLFLALTEPDRQEFRQTAFSDTLEDHSARDRSGTALEITHRPASPAGGEARADGGVGVALPHESSVLHATGEATYTDDILEPRGTLHAALGLSEQAHAHIDAIDLGDVIAAPGVVAVLTALDIPGRNDFGPVVDDDPILAEKEVRFHGQPIFIVVATSAELARSAARRAHIVYTRLPSILTIDDALAAENRILPDTRMRRGDPETAIAAAPRRLAGSVRCGGQDHFYLEGQVALAVPLEDGTLHVHAATQHPSEVQMLIASALGVTAKDVVVECRRMGGGFGGKESQPAQIAAIAALAARHVGRPVKLRLDRDTDMIMTGKRHDFRIDYEVGFDDDGRILGLHMTHAIRAGHSTDLSGAIADRALFHADNAYYLPHVAVDSLRLRTNTVSNTAFRGFGGPQGMFGIEELIDAIARDLGVDALEVRKRNYYGIGERDITPYGQRITDNLLHEMTAALEADADYHARRLALSAWNRDSPIIKRGLALTPVKFGISFTTTHLNQGGALIHVYTDGTVLVNHGGTEMGQGLHTKVAQVVAEELQIDVGRIRVCATDTSKVPNAPATAASSGADQNGKAAQQAAQKIKARLARFAAERYRLPQHEVLFRANRVLIGDRSVPFGDLVRAAWKARVSLSATGFYRTPGIVFDRERFAGHPFYYFAYGVACSEVAIDTLTGETRVLRADLLHDAGRSLNPAIDLGQIEGGFLQGLGWLTMEELWWDSSGKLHTHAPSTYKIPAVSDLPADFRARLWPRGENAEESIFRSKAVGEPPLMLALSVWHAIKDAIAAVTEHTVAPQLNAPATAEEVLRSVADVRRRAGVDATPAERRMP